MRLRTLLGDHPGTAALKNGSIRSDLVEFDFVQYSPTNKGFKPMVREGAFDVSEMAIVTYLMAKSFEKPMVPLPDVVLARFQHGHALYNAKKGKLAPRDLNGKRVGIRSFTTTTGAWLRGILANDYGVDLDSIDWVTFEDGTFRVDFGQLIQFLSDKERATLERIGPAFDKAGSHSFSEICKLANVDRKTARKFKGLGLLPFLSTQEAE